MERIDCWGNTRGHYAALEGAAHQAGPPNFLGATPQDLAELICYREIKREEGYPILADVHVKPLYMRRFFEKAHPGEKWTFLRLLPGKETDCKAGELLQVRLDPQVGRRVFTEAPIEKGRVICEYLGEFYPQIFYQKAFSGYIEMPGGLFAPTESMYINACIDAAQCGSYGSLINDGAPNVHFEPVPCAGGLPLRINVVAHIDIPAHSELTAYYMGHPIRTDPTYVELNPALRKAYTDHPTPLFLSYLFHTPHLLLSLCLKGEITHACFRRLYDKLEEPISWIQPQQKAQWIDYLAQLTARLLSLPKTPHIGRLLDDLSCVNM